MLKYPIPVTIDTNVFDAAKYDFSENSTLSLLINYVQKGKIKIVLSDIVIREAKKHICKQASELCRIARELRTEALNESTENLIDYVGLHRLIEISNKKEIVEKATKLFENFIKNINAEILSLDLINLDTILDDYFSINPPFESSEKKRKEFPDAFIANQIRKKFGEDEMVAIISKDKGFKKACQYTPNHLFFDTLGDLYDKINKEEKIAYNETIDIIKDLQLSISSHILEHIKSNENIDVKGLSYDKDGIESGFDYSEFYLYGISDTSFAIHSIDGITDTHSIVTLSCKSNISVNCFYDDYENAPWDSETKEYVFVETIEMREEHAPNFACRIELDRQAKTFKLLPFIVILGGDSRKNRYRINEQDDFDYEQEIEDMDRESIGFRSLGSYESYLEENLPNSDMHEKIIEQFEKINNMYSIFEDFGDTYDSFLEKMNTHEAKNIIQSQYEVLEKISDFPKVKNLKSIEDDEIENIKHWLSCKFDKSSEIASATKLPDVLNFGESIIINGVDGSKIVLTIDEIEISPTKGSEETIDISLSDGNKRIASGQIKLTIGYLDFNEDNNAADGIEDDIDYEYLQIVEELQNFISEQRAIVEQESKTVKIIKTALENLI